LDVERWALGVRRFPKRFFNTQRPTSNVQHPIASR
jgi:hypothetical protein